PVDRDGTVAERAGGIGVRRPAHRGSRRRRLGRDPSTSRPSALTMVDRGAGRSWRQPRRLLRLRIHPADTRSSGVTSATLIPARGRMPWGAEGVRDAPAPPEGEDAPLGIGHRSTRRPYQRSEPVTAVDLSVLIILCALAAPERSLTARGYHAPLWRPTAHASHPAPHPDRRGFSCLSRRWRWPPSCCPGTAWAPPRPVL